MIQFVFTILAFAISLISAQKVFERPTQLTEVPKTDFSCRGRPTGYYADIDAGCQSYHMCAGNKKYSYLCPHLTLFHQKYMVCNHFVAVDCTSSEKYFDLNLKIGQSKDKGSHFNRIDKKPSRKKKSKTNKTSKASGNASFKKRILKIENTVQTSTKRPNSKPKQSTSITSQPSPKKGIGHPFLKNEKPKTKKPFKIGGRGEDKFSLKSSFLKKPPKLRPLVVRSRSNFDQRSFTIPVLPATTPIPDTSDENERPEPSPTQNLFTIPDILLPPALPNPINKKTNSPPQFLIPPRQAAVIIDGENQEIRTPLSLSRFQAFSRSFSRPHESQLSSVRGNPAFFIPESGLVPPLLSNSLEDNTEEGSQELMTMIFSKSQRSPHTLLLPVNPDCPRCHPAFLRPNQCNPCVIIK